MRTNVELDNALHELDTLQHNDKKYVGLIMKKLNQYFSLSIVFLGATNFSQVSLAQYNVPMQPPVPRHDTMFRPRAINNYNKDICYTIHASEWRNYLRQRSSGVYPTAEDIRLQRKWETKKGCAHLYEADGTVNRVKGINY
ncbi:MAG: hypothetical protein HC852_23620 [Acaryochloridaceae cyanobacterium RU_4_10]|nr:hypothetical protein [Acaryochloridaceae cyanobacterium RU_4_10]